MLIAISFSRINFSCSPQAKHSAHAANIQEATGVQKTQKKDRGRSGHRFSSASWVGDKQHTLGFDCEVVPWPVLVSRSSSSSVGVDKEMSVQMMPS